MPLSRRLSADVPVDFNILSPVGHSAFASDAIVGRIPTGSVHLCSASTLSHRRALFPYPATDDGEDLLLDYLIQNDIEKVDFFATKNRLL